MSDGHKTAAFVNSPSHFADIGKFKVCPFDHPWGKLDDLLAGRISCAVSLRTTMPLTRSTSAACCMLIPRLRGVEAQNEQLQLGAFRVWEVGNSGNPWPMALVTARSCRARKRPHSRYRAGSSVLKNKGWRVWTRVTKVVKRAWRLRWCKPASRARRSRSLPIWFHALAVPEDGGSAGAQQVDRAAGVGASAVEAASAGPLHGLQRSTV